MDSAGPYLKLVGRVLLSIMFIQSGVGKIFGYAGTEEHMNAAGVPGPSFLLSSSLRWAAVFSCCLGFLLAMRRSLSPVSACSPPGSSTISRATWAR